MLTNDQINALLDSLEHKSYQREVESHYVKLNDRIASAIGTSKYKTVNILATVVDAIAGKLFIQDINADDVTTLDAVTQWLTANQSENLQRKLYRATVRDGESFVLVRMKNNIPTLSLITAFDGKCGAAYIYNSTDSTEVLYAINTYYVGKTKYLDVYYPDHIETYINKEDGLWEARIEDIWPIDWTDAQGNPLGIALIKFDIGESDLDNGTSQIQTWINEALIDLTAVSRTMGFPQRVLKGATNPEFITDQYGQPLQDIAGRPYFRKLVLEPGSIFTLQGKDAQLDQLDAAEPNTTVIDKYLHLLSILTTVPMHYFNGEWPSGIALIQSEMRLNSLVESHQDELSPAVITMLQMMVKISNTFANTTYNIATQWIVTWYPPEIETEDLRMEKQKTTAQVVFQLKNAQVLSIETAVRILHEEWTEDQIQAEVARIQGESAIL